MCCTEEERKRYDHQLLTLMPTHVAKASGMRLPGAGIQSCNASAAFPHHVLMSTGLLVQTQIMCWDGPRTLQLGMKHTFHDEVRPYTMRVCSPSHTTRKQVTTMRLTTSQGPSWTGCSMSPQRSTGFLCWILVRVGCWCCFWCTLDAMAATSSTQTQSCACVECCSCR